MTLAVGLVPPLRGARSALTGSTAGALEEYMREKQPLHYRCASTRRNFKHRLNQACPSVFTAASPGKSRSGFLPATRAHRCATASRSAVVVRTRQEEALSSTQAGDILPLQARPTIDKASIVIIAAVQSNSARKS